MHPCFRLTLVVVVLSLFFSEASAQKSHVLQPDSATLKEWRKFDAPIYSASKKEETLFEAPLSSYVVTSDDIQRSGVLSIAEALRLAPGVIVREVTTGVFDIHILGFENTVNYGPDFKRSNAATLIMIDSRPVMSRVIDGTYLEALPVDLIDVDRIEVIRGPAGVLFGQNAVQGVIHIITKRHSGKTAVQASALYGTPYTEMGNLFFGQPLGDKLNFTLSGNYQLRSRPKNWASGNYDQRIAIRKTGINSAIDYTIASDVILRLSGGYQESHAERHTYQLEPKDMLTYNSFKSSYANLDMRIHKLLLRGSFQAGKDNLDIYHPPNKTDYRFGDFELEYDFSFFEDKLTVTPGFQYQSLYVSDLDYPSNGEAFFSNLTYNLHTTSFYVRTDFQPIEKLRIAAAIRAEQFSMPSETYVSYQLAGSYALSKNFLIRTSLSKAVSAPSATTNYLDLYYTDQFDNLYHVTGDRTLDLFTINRFDAGFRARLNQESELEFEVFRQEATGFTSLRGGTYEKQFVNEDLTAIQTGVTLSLNLMPRKMVMIKPFMTFQQTQKDDSNKSFDKSSPKFYGGFIYDMMLWKKLNLNVNAYYFSEAEKYDNFPRYLVNVSTRFSLTRQLIFHVTARNVLNELNRVGREYWRGNVDGDSIYVSYVGGITFKL